MSADRAPVRSYQRIFKPERRIYQVEGHRLPVPGGVPLGWLAWAIGGLLAVLLLSSRSLALSGLLACAATVYGLAVGGRASAILAGASVLGATQVAGWIVGVLDWPLRLIVVPALAATLLTQATPDGRPAHRYALSWARLQLRPARRSIGRPLPGLDEPRDLSAAVWVASDTGTPLLRRGRILGPARVSSALPLRLSRSRLRRGRLLATQHRRLVSRAALVERVELAAGERLEVRP